MVLNEQKQKNIKADIDDKRSLKERLREQTEGLKKAGKVTGQTIVESMPIIGETIGVKNIARDIKDKDYVGAGIETAALGAGLFPVVGDVAAKGLRSFNKTRKAYKLFVQRKDGLYPLFVDAKNKIPEKEFIEAKFPKEAFTAPNGRTYVPSRGPKRESKIQYIDPDGKKITKAQYDKLGDNAKKQSKKIVSKGEKQQATGMPIIIPDEKTRKKLIEKGYITDRVKRTDEAPFGKVTAVAARPGFHASQFPVATHIGPQDIKISKKESQKLIEAGVTPEAINKRKGQLYVKRRAEDHVYAEVDMADDIDYQSMLAKEGKTDINDRVPVGGSYKYVDGQADSDKWVVGGNMRVNRVLSKKETKKLQEELGVKDLPSKEDVENILGKKFFQGGAVKGDNMYQGVDDYVLAKTNPEQMNMNEGGTPMKKNVEAQQLEMFGDVGKMVKPKTNVDPISGNEVPKGSVPQEVRDDIPAQLSEGEFVLPADVVRYHGLEKLMGLRQQAKLGLNKMDKMGQMGNSEEATIPDDIPFKPKEMQQGGINIATPNTQTVPQGLQITQPKTQIQAPSVFASQQQVQPVAMPKPVTPPVVGVPKPQPVATPIPQTQPKQQQPSFKDLLGTGKGQLQKSETIIYTNPETKEEMYIPFIGGEPLYPIPTGFVKKADAPKEEDKISDTAVKTTQTTQTTPLDEGENKELSTGVKTTKLTETIAKNTEPGTLSKLVSGLGNIIKQGGLAGFVANELFSKKTEEEKKAEKEQFTPESLEEQSQEAYGDSIFRIKGIFGSEPTFKYGSDAGDVDVSTGGTFHASGIALDEDGNAATNNGVMSYGSFKEWANHLGAGASSGWHGGIISASKYESLGEKGKGKSEAQKNYDDYASQVGASSGGQKKSEPTDLEGGVASGLENIDTGPEDQATDSATGFSADDYGEDYDDIFNKGGLMSKPKPKSMKYGGLASKR